MSLAVGCWCVLTSLFLLSAGLEECPEEQSQSRGRAPQIQLRAILIRCPFRSHYSTYNNRDESPDVAISRGKQILQFYGFGVDEPLLHSEVVRCRRKLVITIKFSLFGKFKKESEYVVVDHAYDPAVKEKVRLLNPIVLKIFQGPVMQAYPMRIVHVVNAEATEEVIHKGIVPQFKGCSTQILNATCGNAYYKGARIPYSEGFCCSCDAAVNMKRQPLSYTSGMKSDLSFSQESGAMPQPIGILKNTSVKCEAETCPPKFDGERKKRSYPIFPKNYYHYPPMEPAKGFRRSEVKAFRGGINPWEVARPQCYFYYKGMAQTTTMSAPYYHILWKRFQEECGNLSLSESNSSAALQRFPLTLGQPVDNPIGISKKTNEEEEPSRTRLKHVRSDLGNKGGCRKAAEGAALRRAKRQVSPSGLQVRGGQDCIDRSHPHLVNPVTYHESAHCLRFSDLWYNVYQVKTPFLAHNISFEIYEKHCNEPIPKQWILRTRGHNGEVGIFKRRAVNKDTSIVFSYTPLAVLNEDLICLSQHRELLLVPRMVPKEKMTKYPQPFEPSGRYLLLKRGEVNFDGDDCDNAGVSYSAFARQPDRCERPRGTCLANQPLQMWRHDMNMIAQGKKGKYFLENYAQVPDKAIVQFNAKEFLNLHYDGEYESVVEVEYKIDTNAILRRESTVQVSEILVDSTCSHHTRITIVVTNNGLVSSLYRPRMTSCPVNIPAVWYKQEGPLVSIPPMRNHIFRLSLYGALPSHRFYCSIEILNKKRKIVAVRRVRIQKYERCFCMWHCLCACVSSLEHLQCYSMTMEHFHAAGFIGSFPVDTTELPPESFKLSRILFLTRLVSIIFAIHLYFLLFGVTKAVLGLFSRKLSLLYLYLVCPIAFNEFENSDLAVNGQYSLRVLEFLYNVICFFVAPGWIVLYFLEETIIAILNCLILTNIKLRETYETLTTKESHQPKSKWKVCCKSSKSSGRASGKSGRSAGARRSCRK